MPVGNILSIVCIAVAAGGLWFALLAWIAMEWSRRKENRRTKRHVSRLEFASRYLLRWTWFDYYMMFSFLLGFVFLISDVVGVSRQTDIYPSWHFGYVLIGITVLLHAFLYFLSRYVFLLRYNELERIKKEAA